MTKRILALVLCVALVFALAACGGGDNNSSAGGTNSTSTGGDAAAEAIANRKAGEPVHLNINWVNSTGAPSATADVANEMSKITEEKLGITVEMVVNDWASHNQNLTLSMSGGEQIDLFQGVGMNITQVVASGYCIDMNEDNLLQTYGKGILDTINTAYLPGYTRDGILYGTPTMRDFANGQGSVVIAEQYLDGIGYQYSKTDNTIKTTEAEIDNIFAQLHEKYPNIWVTGAATLTQQIPYDQLGGDNFGVLLDPCNSLKVEEFFGSDLYTNFCKKFYDYNQKGYINPDMLTSQTAGTAEVASGTLMAYWSASKPGIRSQEAQLCQQPVAVFQFGDDLLPTSQVGGIPWCIGYTTADKVASMQLLNELYINPELSTLICWGIEGIHWTKNSEGLLTFPEGVDGGSSTYNASVNWEMPNQFIAGVWEGNPADLWETMDSFNNNAKMSKAIGFSFNNSHLANESTAMANIYSEYQKQLEYGFLDPDVGIPEMVERLKSAGLEKYIAEKQSQLDQWAADNGVS